MGGKKNKTDIHRTVEELSLLFDVSNTLSQSQDVRSMLEPVLELMAERMGMLRGTLTILCRESNEIFTEAAYGLSSQERERGRYRVGEGVVGKVVESGKPVIVPKISEEPRFLNKTRARTKLDKNDISFICVPISAQNEVIGTLSVDRLFGSDVALDEDLRLLSIIASMIAEAVQTRRLIREEREALEEENRRLQNELKDKFKVANMIGNSHAIKGVFDLISRVAPSDTTVFIHGESGVGKELVASAIHYNSDRAARPFVKVNCAAFPENLIESELFGHEKGAFTGAHAQRKGRFELADGGTLFLDEVGELSPMMQVKLLRVLQEKEFERVGGNKTLKVNVRLITATNRDMETIISEGIFRQDLYFRLNVFPIVVAPLRDRKSDIVLLADHFVEKYNKKLGRRVKRISTSAIDMLMSYHWPGNVRELENAIERAVLLSTDDVIHGYHLPPSLQTAEASGTVASRGKLESIISNVERDVIIEALKATRGNCAKAATSLGITERIMGLRVKKYLINPKRFRK